MATLLFPLSMAFRSSHKLVPAPRHMIGTQRLGFATYSKKKNIEDDFCNELDTFGNRRKQRDISPLYKPKTINQELYFKCLMNPNYPIVLGIGPAGCGKTLFACVTAIQELRRGTIQKIVLTRPTVAVEEEELGFLPGNLRHKMDPWTRPIFDIFLEYFQQKDLDTMLYSGVIEICPLAYMRGRTFKRTFIIADEMQNSTPNQMLMLTTRIGDHSKMVITGDLNQSDRSMNNGLLDLMQKIVGYPMDANRSPLGIQLVEMDTADILRSPIVSQILRLYGKMDN
jgi:phosphate starvation-inducible PhoH-like protein